MEGTSISGKTHLTLGEVIAAIRALSPLNVKRLKAYALRFAWTGWEADDLLQEAQLRFLDGRRHCPMGLDIAVALAGAIKSVASERSDQAALIPIFELVPSHGEKESLTTSVITPEGLRNNHTPERILAGRQELAAVKALFAADPPAEAVFDGILAGFEGAELAEVSDISHSDLATVRKRIARRLEATLSKGMEK